MPLSVSSDHPLPVRNSSRMCADLARRGAPGVWVHCVSAAVFVVQSGWSHSPVSLSISSAFMICLLALARPLFFRVLGPVPAAIWSRWYCTTAVLTNLTWGFVSASVLLSAGLEDPLARLLVLILPVLSANAVCDLVPHRATQQISGFVLWIPSLVVAVLPFGRGAQPYVALIIGLFLIYLFHQGKTVHSEYVRSTRQEDELEVARKATEASPYGLLEPATRTRELEDQVPAVL